MNVTIWLVVVFLACGHVVMEGEPNGGSTTTEADKNPATTTEADKNPATTPEADKKPATTPEADKKPAATSEDDKKHATTPEADKQPATTTEADKQPATTTEADKNPGSETRHKQEFAFYPINRRLNRFQLKADKQARIMLSETTSPGKLDHVVEVVIGGWSNQKTAIKSRKAKSGNWVDTPNILSKEEFRGFWLNLNDGEIELGKRGEIKPFLTWSQKGLPKFHYLGVSVTENWIIGDDSPAWVKGQEGSMPLNSVVGGYEKKKLYVCRARYNNAVTPGKMIPSDGLCYVPWGSAERKMNEYEVLTGKKLEWVPTKKGEIPPNAVVGGNSEDGEALYICRVEHDDSTIIGKAQPSHNTCYVAYYGKEKSFDHYEILVEI